MYSTYKLLMEQIRDTNLREFSNEDLVELYQRQHSDEIIGLLYCRNYKILHHIADKFPAISEEDKASIVMEKLLDAINSYKRSTAKFMTYATPIIRNQLSYYVNCYLDCKGRLTQHECLDDMAEFIPDTEKEFKKILELEEMLSHCELTERQFEICSIYVRYGKVTLDDIADMLGTTWSVVSQEKARIREKLAFLKNKDFTVEEMSL